MDVNIFKHIQELGHVNSKREELREYCTSKIDQVLKLLARRILNSDGADLLDCLFNGLSENSMCPKKVKIVDIVLQTMRKESTSLTHCGDVISRLCLELPRLPVNDLLRWSNDCIQSIIDDSDVNMIWRDIVPECVNIILTYDNVKHCGSDMSGLDYKIQCVHTLCQCRWTEKQLVQLAAMFKDMQLSRSDHRLVVNKLCTYVIDVPPDTLPPLVHQLLKLCKLYDVEVVLSHLSHYFNLRLYNKLEPPPQDSESTTMDIEDIVQHSHAELSRCLSTCIYHISQGAAEPELIRKHIKQWPRTQLLRAPFLLDLALAVSDKGSDFRSVCLDVIRTAIEQREMDEIRSKECAWVRALLPPDVNVASLLKVLTTESANHRQLTVLGLINLAFVLLSVSRVKPVASACWSHGKLILVRLCKAQPETAPHVLGQLADKLAGDASLKQYSDCLYVLCKLTPVSVERCAQLSTILESCQVGGDYTHAAATYAAVRPLISFSARVRDTLVMVCRKGLYSRDSSHRRLALSGFLTVLRHVRLSRASASQHAASEQHSAASYLTQLTVELHAEQQGAAVTSRVRNETMCLEVVSILRRCLVQDAAVKQLLYSEIYNCTKEKPALHESLLELLYEHLSKYLPDTEDSSPLLFDKCVQVTATNAILLEPIGHLLYVIAQFLQPEAEESDDVFSSQGDASAHLKTKLLAVMDGLCKRDLLPVTEMEDMGLTDLTPESKAKSLRVQQVLQCYEALIAHQIMQWGPHSTGANSVYKMYKACAQLLDNTKVSPKSKKGKNLNDTRDTTKSQKTQKSQKSQPEKGKAVKLANLMKDRAGPFKPLPCLWDLPLCLRLLHLLYSEEVRWSSVEQRNLLRTKSGFHQWALRRMLTSVGVGVGVGVGAGAAVAGPALDIAALLYERCVCRFQDICDFDDHSALGCLELFKACLDLLFSPNYSLKIESVLRKITGLTEAPPSESVAEILDKVHAALTQLEADSDVEERDVVLKKLIAALVLIANVLLEAPVLACDTLIGVIVKLEDYTRTSSQECIFLIPSLLSASSQHQQEAQLLDELLAKLGSALGIIDEEETSAEESTLFPSIDARTGHTVLNHVCAHLNARLRCTEHLLARARDLTAALANATHGHQQRLDKELQQLYEGIVVQLCQLARWTGGAARLRCGAGGERVASACARLYAAAAMLARQLTPALAAQLRLERLLKLCGRKMSSITDSLITYLEASPGRAGKRDARLVPRLVLAAEHFSKDVIILGKKNKLNYQQYLSLGTARDFRIKGPVLQEVLNAMERRPNDADDDETDINDAATEVLSPASDHEAHYSDEENNASKRRKLA